MSRQSYGQETPTTKPQQPTADPPSLALPPSLPDQTFFNHDLENTTAPVRRGSAWEQPVARSLTNNDHSLIPQSLGGGSGIKMGQSPTILSILSGAEQANAGMSFSSRTYVATTGLQQHDQQQHQHQYQQHPQSHQGVSLPPQQYPANNYFGQYPPPQPLHHDEEDEDDELGMDLDQQDLQFDFALEE